MSSKPECEGKCDAEGGHSDTLYRVRVKDLKTDRDYGAFVYCMKAVHRDRAYGLHVRLMHEVEK